MKIKKSKDLDEYLKCPHMPPMKRKSSKEQVLYKLAHPPVEQINAAPDPLLAMAEIQGTIMGTYVNKLEKQHVRHTKKIKDLQGKVQTITLQKDKLDEEKRSKDQKVKYLEAKVRKTEIELQNVKEKVSYLKPRNVKRRDETKQKQISSLEKKLTAKSEDTQKLSEQLKCRETEISEKDKVIQKLKEKFSTKVEREKSRKCNVSKFRMVINLILTYLG